MHKVKRENMTSQAKRYWILLGIVAVFLILFSLTINNFANIMTITNLVRQSAVFTILAVGMTLVIIVGGIDLSVGANIAFSGAVTAVVMNVIGPESAVGAVGGILTSMIVSTAIGALNGVLCGSLGISPFMATLATQTFCKGLTLLVTDSSRIVVENQAYKWLGNAQWKIGEFVIPAVLVILVPFVIFWIWAVKRLPFGIRLYAVGGNPRAAQASGINPKRFIFITYTITGLLSGIATIITVGRASSAQPLAGEGLEFTVITAVVLGGTSLLGGIGTISGTFLGCLLMGTITLGINMINISVFWNYIIKGLCVLVAVLADQTVISAKELLKHKVHHALAADNDKALEAMQNRTKHILELKNINKTFSGVQALKDISLRLESGKVHALMGENGAGKSTLIKILSGVYQRDSGDVFLDDVPVEIHSSQDSQKLGISVIYQEFALVPELSIAQNAFLGKEKRIFNFFLSSKDMVAKAETFMKKLNLKINVNRKVRSLSVSQQQMVEIAKAMSTDAWLVIMDEPTSAITDADKEQLFKVIREMKAAGMAIVYVSHRLAEIFEICDDVTVLRDGNYITTIPVAGSSEQELTKLMVGREVNDIFVRDKSHLKKDAELVLQLRNLYSKGMFEDISFAVRAGEVLGLSGLMGAGRTEVARCIFGMDRYDSGEIILNGETLHLRSPKEALANGICYVSEDRRREGIIPLRSLKENICLADLRRVLTGGMVDDDKQNVLYQEYQERFHIKATSGDQQIIRLSGGNQQKCCLAKMLACKPTLLILDEPTRGIDVGAKKEIHQLIQKLSKENIAIILISSELPEILGASDRILVLAEGKIAGEFDVRDATEETIMERAFSTQKEGAEYEQSVNF